MKLKVSKKNKERYETENTKISAIRKELIASNMRKARVWRTKSDERSCKQQYHNRSAKQSSLAMSVVWGIIISYLSMEELS